MGIFTPRRLPWPPEVAWVAPHYRRYAEAIAFGPNANRFTYYHRITAPYTLEWNIAYMVPMAWYESRGKWWAVNPTSHAAGTYQHLPTYWPGRVASTIRHLTEAGITEPWMGFGDITDISQAYEEEGDRATIGILNIYANIAVAAYLFGIQGPGAWAPSQGAWPSSDFAVGQWSWDIKTRTWQRMNDRGHRAD